MKESALRPVKMKFSIYGSICCDKGEPFHAFPTEYIKDSLSQNILYYCYEEACSVEELSKFCGVPAYYIDLSYLYALMSFSYAEEQYCKFPYPQIKEKWDGNRSMSFS